MTAIDLPQKIHFKLFWSSTFCRVGGNASNSSILISSLLLVELQSYLDMLSLSIVSTARSSVPAGRRSVTFDPAIWVGHLQLATSILSVSRIVGIERKSGSEGNCSEKRKRQTTPFIHFYQVLPFTTHTSIPTVHLAT
jgi:hypothetical protein